MTARNELAPIDETVPIDLRRAYQDAQILGTVPFDLVGPIRSRSRDQWLPHVLSTSNLLGKKLQSYGAGKASLTPTLITELAGLGQRVWDFEIPAPSRHEWVALFAQRVLDEFFVAMGRESPDYGSPSADYFTDQRSTLFLPDELKRNSAKVEKHIRSLQLPNKQQILSDLKSEVCMAAARRLPESRGRIQFDDDTRQVWFDGKDFRIDDVPPYAFLKVIASARPYRVTTRELEELTRLVGTRVSREFGKLPTPLRKLIDTTTAGHCLVLPPKKLS